MEYRGLDTLIDRRVWDKTLPMTQAANGMWAASTKPESHKALSEVYL